MSSALPNTSHSIHYHDKQMQLVRCTQAGASFCYSIVERSVYKWRQFLTKKTFFGDAREITLTDRIYVFTRKGFASGLTMRDLVFKVYREDAWFF